MVLKPFQCPTDFSPRPGRGWVGCRGVVEGARLFGHPDRAHDTAAAKRIGRPNRLAAFAFWLAVYPPTAANNSCRQRLFAILLPSPRARVHIFPFRFAPAIWYGMVHDRAGRCERRVSPHKRFASRTGQKESPEAGFEPKKKRFSNRLWTNLNETSGPLS